MQALRILLVVSGLIAAGPSLAVNKCTAPNGKVHFQDLPCKSDSNSEVMKLTPNGTESRQTSYAVDW